MTLECSHSVLRRLMCELVVSVFACTEEKFKDAQTRNKQPSRRLLTSLSEVTKETTRRHDAGVGVMGCYFAPDWPRS
jgi:hypothetical protein